MILQIVSSGQTGADRAALDFAIEHGFPHGEWCPRGLKAEDRPVPSKLTKSYSRKRLEGTDDRGTLERTTSLWKPSL